MLATLSSDVSIIHKVGLERPAKPDIPCNVQTYANVGS